MADFIFSKPGFQTRNQKGFTPDFDRIADQLNLSRDLPAVRARLIRLESILEGLVTLPGNQRVGLDSVLGFVPVIGDLISATLGAYLVWEARNVGMSRWACTRMLGRVGFDAVLGAIPLVGDVLDIFNRSNSRNLKQILAHIDRKYTPDNAGSEIQASLPIRGR